MAINQDSKQDQKFVIKKPLQLYKSKQRKYVRLEISEPVSFGEIDIDKPLQMHEPKQFNGTILNISGGGLLLDTEIAPQENSYITLELDLSDIGIINGVVGKVKRVDDAGDGAYLLGVEFVGEDELSEVFGSSNIGSVISSFDDRIKRLLLKYVFVKKANDKLNRENSED